MKIESAVMRIHELAKRLGWPSKRVIDTLRERGEYATSAMSKVEDPVARAMLRDFAADISTPSEQLPDEAIDPAVYGWSAAAGSDASRLSFAADLALVKAQPLQQKPDGKPQLWLPPILRVLLYEMVIPWRPDHLGEPEGDYYAWELRNARELQKEWAEAQLNGLQGDDETIIQWIRLTGDGKQAHLAVDLSGLGITVDEAGLQLTNGWPDTRRASIFRRYRNGHLTATEALAEIRQSRRNQSAG